MAFAASRLLFHGNALVSESIHVHKIFTQLCGKPDCDDHEGVTADMLAAVTSRFILLQAVVAFDL